jgi:hypothetical protein
MNYGHHRLDIRFIVFTHDDIYEGLRQLLKSAKTADVEPGDSGVIAASVGRAARWTIRNEHDVDMPPKPAHLEPFAFNLWFLYRDRNELVETLKHFIQIIPHQIRQLSDSANLSAEMQEHVPGMGGNGPMGLWELTRVRLEPPTAHRFRDTPIWDY